MRLYWPRSEALDGKWKAPPLVQLTAAKAAPLTGLVPVTPDNFPRAESDLYFGNIVKDGGFGQFTHRREPAAIDKQTIIRLNRDTLYSAAIFDLDSGPVTITLPDGAPLSSASRNIERHLDLPRGSARELSDHGLSGSDGTFILSALRACLSLRRFSLACTTSSRDRTWSGSDRPNLLR
jgi:Protein of unknown function (DUF1254)